MNKISTINQTNCEEVEAPYAIDITTIEHAKEQLNISVDRFSNAYLYLKGKEKKLVLGQEYYEMIDDYMGVSKTAIAADNEFKNGFGTFVKETMDSVEFTNIANAVVESLQGKQFENYLEVAEALTKIGELKLL